MDGRLSERIEHDPTLVGTTASASEVVQVVEVALSTLRAERDQLRAVLRRVADSPFPSRPNPDGTFAVHLSPELMGEVARAAWPT